MNNLVPSRVPGINPSKHNCTSLSELTIIAEEARNSTISQKMSAMRSSTTVCTECVATHEDLACDVNKKEVVVVVVVLNFSKYVNSPTPLFELPLL